MFLKRSVFKKFFRGANRDTDNKSNPVPATGFGSLVRQLPSHSQKWYSQLGFAMGTAKQVSWLQFWIFKLVLTRLYPEPYRIPKFLQPAFDLGVQCGQQTGAKNLYRQKLKKFRGLTLGEAREAVGIDMQVLRRFYELEQQRIPFTIASLRLP